MTQIFWTYWAIYLSILTRNSWVKWERSNRLNFPETIFFKSSYSSSLPFISQMWTLQHFFHSTSCSPGNFWKFGKIFAPWTDSSKGHNSRANMHSVRRRVGARVGYCETYSEIAFLNAPQMTSDSIIKFDTRRHIVQSEFAKRIFILIISSQSWVLFLILEMLIFTTVLLLHSVVWRV